MTMIKAINSIRIQKGRADEVAIRFREPKSVHTFDGFILMEVLKNEENGEYDELLVATTWKNRASFDSWQESRASAKAHGSQNVEIAGEDNPILGARLSILEVCARHHPAGTNSSI